MLKIVQIPHPALTKQTKPVQKIDRKIRQLVSEMEKALDAQRNPEGVGLSAPQVASDHAIFIIKHPKEKILKPFINPRLTRTRMYTKEERRDYDKTLIEEGLDPKEEQESLEGCLSIPEIWAHVDRHDVVEVTYQTINGDTVVEEFDGFFSVVVQHEYDHLQGILFTQRAVEQGHKIYREVNGKLREVQMV